MNQPAHRRQPIKSRVFRDSEYKHGLALPPDTTPTDVLITVRDAHGKEIFTKGDSIKDTFSVSREDVAKSLNEDEIAEDLKTFFKAIEDLST